MTIKSAKALAAETGERLYRLLAAEWFWCDTCHGLHPLAEHRGCREQLTRTHAAMARQALTDALGDKP